MDLSILKWIHETFHHIPFLNYTFNAITFVGDGWGTAIIVLLLIIFKPTRRAGIAVAVAYALKGLCVDAIIKNIVRRPRPWTEYELFCSSLKTST